MAAIDLKAKKLELIQAVVSASTEEVIWEKIKAIWVSSTKNGLEGYWLDGTPINDETMKLQLKRAEEDRKNGRRLTQEEFEKEAENW